MARKLNEDGLHCIEKGDFDAAEKRFREALDFDLYCVAAHNNLGVTMLRKERWYEAAWEFNHATKLDPQAVEPRGNLGLLYENLARLEQAITQYEAALNLDPQNFVTMRHLARAYIKEGRNDQKIRTMLEQVLSGPADKQWDSWARGQLIRLGRIEEEDALHSSE